MGEYDSNATPDAYAFDSEPHSRNHYAGSSKAGDSPGRDPIPGLKRIRDDLNTLYPNHALLGPLHAKTTTGDPVRGDIITAQGATPLWTKLARSVPAANVRNALGLDNGDTEPVWKTTLDATTPVAITPGGAGAAGTSLIFSHRDHDHPSANVADSRRDQWAYLATSQQLTSNSTTFQNVTGMAVLLAANEVWRFSMTLIFISTVAADFKFQFTVPAGATLFFATGSFILGGIPTQAGSVGASISTPADGLAGNVAIEIYGTVINGANAGNLQLQAAQNTATVEAIDFVVAGTNMTGRRVNP